MSELSSDSTDARRFDIALSFPDEHRDFIANVAGLLAARFGKERVLYDKYHDAEFARLGLNIYLPALYRKESELIVLFLCPEYASKPWCGLEWRHISQLIGTPDAKRILLKRVAIFAKACFEHPSSSKRQKLNATAIACGAPAVLRLSSRPHKGSGLRSTMT